MRFLLLLAALLFSGCCHVERRSYPQTVSPAYWRVVTMNPSGELYDSWTAQGAIRRTEFGYRFTAVERRICHPRREYCFPLGWEVTVLAYNIVIYPTVQPSWMRDPVTVARRAEACAGMCTIPRCTAPRHTVSRRCYK